VVEHVVDQVASRKIEEHHTRRLQGFGESGNALVFRQAGLAQLV